MKTNISIRQNSNHFYLLGLLSLLLASCGSYQNSSYHDNDGVYGNSSSNRYVQQSTGTNNQYKDYFRSLQDDNQPTEIFTDVDNYTNYAENDSTQTASVGYPAWGSSNSEVSVNVYSDPTWSFGFGMGYPYYGWGYGGYWGWGYPGYWGGGWGYPSYWGPGWGYPGYWGGGYYGYNNYNYSYGRRGSAAYYGNRNYASNRNYTSNRGYTSNRNYTTNRNTYNSNRNYTTNRSSNGYSDFRRSSTVNRGTSSPTFTNRRANTNSVDYNAGRRSYNNSSNTTTNRSYTPSNNSNSSRSYTPSSPSRSMNSGGGSMRSSGGGGGGGMRSGGGGGGRR